MRFIGLPAWAVVALIAGSAGLLALLHVLRVRPRELRVVTTLFWAQAVEQTRARTLWERFRHPLTYALLVTICALLALALGRPEFSGSASRRVHAVIVLDAGASMAAADGGGTRLDSARERALAELSATGADDRTAVIVADPEPRLLAGFDLPRPLIGQRLRRVRPAEHPAGRERAVALARSLVNGRTRPRILLLTDRPFEEPAATAPALPLEVARVGRPADNAAVIAAQFTPNEDEPLTGRLAVRVAFHGERGLTLAARIQRAGGAPLLDEAHTFVPGEVFDFTLPRVPADGDEVIVRLTTSDAVAADDGVRFRLPMRKTILARAPAGLPPTLQAALAGDPALRLAEVNDNADVDLLIDPSSSAFQRPALVLRTQGPPAPRAAVRVNERIPWLRDLDFESALAGKGSALALPSGAADVLVMADQTPLAAWLGDPSGPRLELGSALFDVDSVAARRAAFAALVARGIRRLAGWTEGPIVLSPRRAADDPLWPAAFTEAAPAVMPADRASADLTAVGSALPAEGPPGRRGTGLLLFEWLLALAAVAVLIEGVLHARGRIS